MTRYEDHPQNFGSLENTAWAWSRPDLRPDEKLMLLAIANGLHVDWSYLETQTGMLYSELVLAGATLLKRNLAAFEDGYWTMPEERW